MSRSRLPEIERLRGIAVLLVIYHHMNYLDPVRSGLLSGWTGVDLFFVISGYVVTRSLLPTIDVRGDLDLIGRLSAAGAALKAFYLRRLFRIMPAAVFAVGLYVVAAMFFNTTGAFGAPRAIVKELIAFLTLTHNYYITYSGISANGSDTIGHYWSLNVEEHFYLLLPLMLVSAGTMSRRVATAAVGIAVVVLLVRPLGDPGDVAASSYYRFLSHNRFDSLLAGVLLALLMRDSVQDPTSMRERAPWLLLSCLLVAGIWSLPAVVPFDVMWRVGFCAVWAMSALLVYLASLNRNYVFGVPGLGAALEFIGTRSYSMYLVHMLVIRGQTEARARAPLGGIVGWMTHSVIGQLIVGLGATVLISAVMFRFLETPLREYGRRLGQSVQRRAA